MKIFAIGVQNINNNNSSRHLNFTSTKVPTTSADAFVSKIKDNFAIKNLSVKEFNVLKTKIINKTKTFTSFIYIDVNKINKWNAQLFDYMLQNPKEYKAGHHQIADSIAGTYNSCDNKSSAEVILKMLKMPWLFKSGNMEYSIWKIGDAARNAKVADIKTQMLDLLVENKIDYSDRQLTYIGDMLVHFDSDKGLNFAKKLIEKPAILEAPCISKDFFRRFENDKSCADVSSAVLDKINSKPELLQDENFMERVHGFLHNVTDEKGKDFAFKILDNPILFKSESFTKSLNNLLYHYPTDCSEKSEAIRLVKNEIIDAAIANPKLFENKKFLEEFGDLLFIEKQGDWILCDNRPLEIGKKNLFLIKNGYYNAE